MLKALHSLNVASNSKATYIFKDKLRLKSVLGPVLTCFLILLLLRDYFFINIPSIIFLVLSFLLSLFANKTELISFCFCCIPMLNAFQSKYALVICMILYIIRFGRRPKITVRIWPVFALLVWEIAHSLVGPFSLIEVFRLFAELLFCCFLMCCSVDEWDYTKVFRSMSLTTVCVCFIILIAQMKVYNYRSINVLFSGVFRFGYGTDVTKMSVGFNPNYLAYICLACIEGLAFNIIRKKHRFIDILLIVLLGFFGLFTMSKKFILCAVIFLVLLFLASDKAKSKIRIFLVSTLLVLSIGLILYYCFPTIYENLISRFNADDLSTGRESIFQFYMNELTSDIKLLLFGVGLQSYEYKLLTTYPGASIPHNGFQELLVMWGVFGLVVFVIFIVNLLIQAKSINKNIKFVNYIPFLVMLANVQVTQMVSSSVTNMIMAFVYLCLTIDCCEDRYNNVKNRCDRN